MFHLKCQGETYMHWCTKEGAQGGHAPPPVDQRVKKKDKKGSDFSKPIHITYPTPTLHLHLMCKKCQIYRKKISLPSLPPLKKSWLYIYTSAYMSLL